MVCTEICCCKQEAVGRNPIAAEAEDNANERTCLVGGRLRSGSQKRHEPSLSLPVFSLAENGSPISGQWNQLRMDEGMDMKEGRNAGQLDVRRGAVEPFDAVEA